MDAEILSLARALRAGDAHAARRLVAALARVKGDPLARLKKLLAKTNGLVRHPTWHRTLAWRDARRRSVVKTLEKALEPRTRAQWAFGAQHVNSSFATTAPRDTTALLAVNLDHVVVVGVGIADCRNPRVSHAWPAITKRNNPGFDLSLVAWAEDWFAEDRVAFTVDQVRALVAPRRTSRVGGAEVSRGGTHDSEA